MSHAARALSCAGALALVLSFVGCGGGSTATESNNSALPAKPEAERAVTNHEGGPAGVFDLYAGQHILVGTVTVSNSDTHLSVAYHTDDPWTMDELHLYVGTTYPTKLAPGQFPYHATNLGGVTDYTFEVPLGSWDCGTDLIMAAHGVVKSSGIGGTGQTETAWGKGETPFPKKWGWFMDYTVVPHCELPAGQVTINAAYPSPNSYWGLQVTAGGGGTIINGGYLGWCVDLAHTLAPGSHTGTLYSSLDPNLPAHLQDDDWDMLNYVINHKQGSVTDVQNAIWYFVGGGGLPTGAGLAMVNDALANGEGFYPVTPQKTAIIIDLGSVKQLLILEGDCACN